MSEDQDSDDKPYDPTPKRLEEARKRGEIPRSVDLTAAASYGGILAAAAVLGPVSVATLGTALIVLLDQADRLAPLMLGDGQAALANVRLEGSGTEMVSITTWLNATVGGMKIVIRSLSGFGKICHCSIR